MTDKPVDRLKTCQRPELGGCIPPVCPYCGQDVPLADVIPRQPVPEFKPRGQVLHLRRKKTP